MSIQIAHNQLFLHIPAPPLTAEKTGDYLMPHGVNVKKPNLVEIRAEQGGINMHAQTRLAVGMTRRAACRV